MIPIAGQNKCSQEVHGVKSVEALLGALCAVESINKAIFVLNE